MSHASVTRTISTPEPVDAANTLAFMLVRVGGRRLALDARMVEEVAVKGAVTRVPTAARHVLGVASLRGSLVPVVSLEQMLGVKGPARSDAATALPRLVVVRADEYEIALVVDEICGIVEERPAEFTAEASGADRPCFLREEFAWQGNLVCVLDVPLLIATAAGRSTGGD